MPDYDSHNEILAAGRFIEPGDPVQPSIPNDPSQEVSKGLDTAYAYSRMLLSMHVQKGSTSDLGWEVTVVGDLTIATKDLQINFGFEDPQSGLPETSFVVLSQDTYSFGANTIMLVQVPAAGVTQIVSSADIGSKIQLFADEASVQAFVKAQEALVDRLEAVRWVPVAWATAGALNLLGKIHVPSGRTLVGGTLDDGYVAATGATLATESIVNQDRNLILYGDLRLELATIAPSTVKFVTTLGTAYLYIADRVVATLNFGGVTLDAATPYLTVTIPRGLPVGSTPVLAVSASSGAYDPATGGNTTVFLGHYDTVADRVVMSTGAIIEPDGAYGSIIPGQAASISEIRRLDGDVIRVNIATGAGPAVRPGMYNVKADAFLAVLDATGAFGEGVAARGIAAETLYPLQALVDGALVVPYDFDGVEVVGLVGREGGVRADVLVANNTLYVNGVEVGSELTSLDGRINTNAVDIITANGNIATNAGDISTNAGDISTNAGDIATLQADVATAVTKSTPYTAAPTSTAPSWRSVSAVPAGSRAYPSSSVPFSNFGGLDTDGIALALAYDNGASWEIAVRDPTGVAALGSRNGFAQLWGVVVNGLGQMLVVEDSGANVNIYILDTDDGTFTYPTLDGPVVAALSTPILFGSTAKHSLVFDAAGSQLTAIEWGTGETITYLSGSPLTIPRDSDAAGLTLKAGCRYQNRAYVIGQDLGAGGYTVQVSAVELDPTGTGEVDVSNWAEVGSYAKDLTVYDGGGAWAAAPTSQYYITANRHGVFALVSAPETGATGFEDMYLLKIPHEFSGTGFRTLAEESKLEEYWKPAVNTLVGFVASHEHLFMAMTDELICLDSRTLETRWTKTAAECHSLGGASDSILGISWSWAGLNVVTTSTGGDGVTLISDGTAHRLVTYANEAAQFALFPNSHVVSVVE